jgi:F-type H+-transporting ATPase subunit epsilon
MLKFKIVTPEKVLMEREVDSVTVTTQNGEITILKNHLPLVSNLKAGELKLKAQGDQEIFAVSGGFIEVRENNEVVILADTAEHASEIDIDKAEQAKELARKMMEENYHDHTASAEAVAMLEKNLARLRVARKHRTHTNRNLESGVLHE